MSAARRPGILWNYRRARGARHRAGRACRVPVAGPRRRRSRAHMSRAPQTTPRAGPCESPNRYNEGGHKDITPAAAAAAALARRKAPPSRERLVEESAHRHRRSITAHAAERGRLGCFVSRKPPAVTLSRYEQATLHAMPSLAHLEEVVGRRRERHALLPLLLLRDRDRATRVEQEDQRLSAERRQKRKSACKEVHPCSRGCDRTIDRSAPTAQRGGELLGSGREPP